jgi:hypothetical protein
LDLVVVFEGVVHESFFDGDSEEVELSDGGGDAVVVLRVVGKEVARFGVESDFERSLFGGFPREGVEPHFCVRVQVSCVHEVQVRAFDTVFGGFPGDVLSGDEIGDEPIEES